jgi:hypothetical protein
MPVHVTCKCGTRYTFKDEFAGSRTVCPACKREMIVPAEDDDAAPPEKPGKGVLIVAISATSAVVVTAVVFLIVHYSGAPPKPAPAIPPPDMSPSVKVASPNRVPVPPEKDPLLAPPTGKAATPTSPTKAGGADASTLAPAEFLVPFRTEGTNYYILLGAAATEEEYKKMHDSFRAAHIMTVGEWIDWIGGGPDRAPGIAFVRKPFPKGRVLATYDKFTPREERETLKYGDEKAPKEMRVTWLLYQDVGFGVDDLGNVAAIRVDAWPAKPAEPAP